MLQEQNKAGECPTNKWPVPEKMSILTWPGLKNVVFASLVGKQAQNILIWPMTHPVHQLRRSGT